MQYLGPSPGLPHLAEQPTKEPSLDSCSGPVDAFCLLVFDPDQVCSIFFSRSVYDACILHLVSFPYVTFLYLSFLGRLSESEEGRKGFVQSRFMCKRG